MFNWFKRKEEEVVLPVEITGDTTYCVFQYGRLVGGIAYWKSSRQWEFNSLPYETLNQETIEAIFNKLAELNLYEVSG